MQDDQPARIWLVEMGDETVWSCDPDPNDCGILDGVEYIRADTIATLQARLDKAVEGLERIASNEEIHPTVSWKTWSKQIAQSILKELRP